MKKEKRKTDLDQIDARIKAAKSQADNAEVASNNSSYSSLDMGFRVSADMLSAVLVGAGMGYLFDSWFNTKPLLMVVFIVLGTFAGVKNVKRTVKDIEIKNKINKCDDIVEEKE